MHGKVYLSLVAAAKELPKHPVDFGPGNFVQFF